MEETTSDTVSEPQYFQVDKLKFCLMSICTFGLYEIYWSYRNWRFVKERDESEISVFWRTAFAALWYHALLRDISENSNSRVHFSGVAKVVWAGAYLIISAQWNQIDPYWLVSFLTFIPILPAIGAIEALNGPAQPSPRRNTHSAGNFAIYLFGGALFLETVLSSFNYIPSTQVVDGSRLWTHDVAFLVEEGLIEEDERILYFYSDGYLSIEDDGQLISEDYVVSYSRDPSNGELIGLRASYAEIMDVSVAWSESFFDITVITVTLDNSDEYELWLSAEEERDKVFVDELTKRWKAARDAYPPGPDELI